MRDAVPPAPLPADYRPVLPPFAHQREALARSHRKRVFALFMEQGLGKTKVTIDTCALLYTQGTINALLVVAPNDVHAQWVEEQFRVHWPPSLPLRAAIWNAGSARAVRECMTVATRPLPARFHVLAMNHEALATRRGRTVAERFLRAYKAMFVIDESHAIKNWHSARTRAALALAPLAPVRRILTGTPKGQSPFDFYTQFQFLDKRILGFDSFVAFKARYGVFSTEHVTVFDKRRQRKVVREYAQLLHYQRLDELNARMDPYVFRARKVDCIDLPPKLPVTRYVTLSSNQQAMYDELKERGLLLLEQTERNEADAQDVARFIRMDDLADEELLDRLNEARGRVSLKIKLVLDLRLHQILGGFVTDDEGVVHAIDPPSAAPRLTALAAAVTEALQSSDGKVIVWAAFRAELEAIARHLDEQVAPGAVALVHGGTPRGRRTEMVARFKDAKDSRVRVLVAHPRTMGTGQNFTVAQSAWYYSNTPSYVLRAQSEDRIHRIGTRGTVTIGDFVARPGHRVDALRLEVLRGHADMADFFMKHNAASLRSLL